MKEDSILKDKRIFKTTHFWFKISLIIFLVLASLFIVNVFNIRTIYYERANFIKEVKGDEEKALNIPIIPKLDKDAYDKKMNELANNPPDPIVYETIKSIEKDENGKTITKITKVPVSPQPVVSHLWPPKTVYPNDGALLPFNRIVAYYGNLYSKKMGALGEFPEEEMLTKLMTEVDNWNEADPETPAIPALHYIAVTAQLSPGTDGKYRARMPSKEIDKVIEMAKKINAIVFLDIQVGLSTIETELPFFEKYFKMPQVHLGIDPEFSMKTGIRPGKVVGTFDATDINYTAEYLAKIVKENNLTPKILIIHRFTQKMVTNYNQIKPLPEVQVVMDMDGWGGGPKKFNTYKQFIYKEPVQFAGFKLFYKNDTLEPNSVLLTSAQLLKLNPKPIYIQYH